MISSTDGWIVGANGSVYHWQEQGSPVIPADFLLIIVGAFVVVVVVVWALRAHQNEVT